MAMISEERASELVEAMTRHSIACARVTRQKTDGTLAELERAETALRLTLLGQTDGRPKQTHATFRSGGGAGHGTGSRRKH